jgi:hypothetical protein
MVWIMELVRFILPAARNSGAAAVCVVLTPQKVFAANCGSALAMLIRNGKPVCCLQ